VITGFRTRRGKGMTGQAWQRIGVALFFACGVMHAVPAMAADARAPEAPLIEADKAPTRVRPTAPATTATPTPPPAMSLPVRGIPVMPKITPPSDSQEVEVAAVAPAKAVHGQPGGGRARAFKVQLASTKTAAGAAKQASTLRSRFAHELSTTRLSVERGPRGAWYRVVSAPVEDRREAGELCAALVAARGSCLVVATHMAPGQPAPAGKTMIAQHRAPEHRAMAAKPVRAQLASLRSFDGAARELDRLNRRYADVLERTPLAISRIDQGDRGVFYRVVTAPLPNRSAASGLCHRISLQAGCILIPGRERNAEIIEPSGPAAKPA